MIDGHPAGVRGGHVMLLCGVAGLGLDYLAKELYKDTARVLSRG